MLAVHLVCPGRCSCWGVRVAWGVCGWCGGGAGAAWWDGVAAVLGWWWSAGVLGCAAALWSVLAVAVGWRGLVLLISRCRGRFAPTGGGGPVDMPGRSWRDISPWGRGPNMRPS